MNEPTTAGVGTELLCISCKWWEKLHKGRLLKDAINVLFLSLCLVRNLSAEGLPTSGSDSSGKIIQGIIMQESIIPMYPENTYV